jgi:threonine/homoserine/homoserine lactone efflux protein
MFFVVILGSSIFLYSAFAERVGDKIESVQARRKMNHIGGGALVGAGLITATIGK